MDVYFHYFIKFDKMIVKNQNSMNSDFPGGAVDKYLPANAGDTGLSPGLERFDVPQRNQAYAPQLLKPPSLDPVLHNKRSHCNEKPTRYNEE